jgi:hypothetical protein
MIIFHQSNLREVFMYEEAGGGLGAGLIILYLVLAVFYIVVMWKIFVKAGKPGWGCIIPIYNIILQMEIAGRPGWWVLLMFIPGVNVIINIIVLLDIAKAFGKGTGFGIGLILLGFIFLPILAFGDAKYIGIQRQ